MCDFISSKYRWDLTMDYENGIYGFKDEYRWLSNFTALETPVEYCGIKFYTTEQLYQACKCKRHEQFVLFDGLTAAESKKFGRQVEMRSNWDSIRLPVMFQIQMIKYKQPRFNALLRETGDRYIEEKNQHKDQFFGVYNGIGENHLGKIIMDIRDNYLFKKDK